MARSSERQPHTLRRTARRQVQQAPERRPGHVRSTASRPSSALVDYFRPAEDLLSGAANCSAPFDLDEAVSSLREERYAIGAASWADALTSSAIARQAYYLARPLLPVGVRRHLQKVRLQGWRNIAFPAWPVDVSVERLMERSLLAQMKSARCDRLPFVWFWPDGAGAAVMMTHDVETAASHDRCEGLMDLDASFGVRSAFQVVPDVDPMSARALVRRIQARGFEVNVHDLNHDGRLFTSRALFLARAEKINRYAREWGCRGFRSGAMYRRQEWFDALDVSYDMSVPNVAHLEPQRGGCCTVMPYFVGDVLELPLTTTQDYSLFHILADYSIELWRRQLSAIVAHHGLASFIAHPEYLDNPRARRVYIDLLEHLRRIGVEQELWMAPPGEINDWWRCRQAMSVRRRGGSWHIQGPGSERARVAFARLDGDRLFYELAETGSIPAARPSLCPSIH